MMAPTLRLREHAGGGDDLFDRLGGASRPAEVPEERRPPEVRQGATDVRLEQHDRREHAYASRPGSASRRSGSGNACEM